MILACVRSHGDRATLMCLHRAAVASEAGEEAKLPSGATASTSELLSMLLAHSQLPDALQANPFVDMTECRNVGLWTHRPVNLSTLSDCPDENGRDSYDKSYGDNWLPKDVSASSSDGSDCDENYDGDDSRVSRRRASKKEVQEDED